MPAYCKTEPTVTTLLEHHQRCWDICNKKWATGDWADTDDVDELTVAGMALDNTKPATVQEWVAKWRRIVRFEIEMKLDDLDYLPAMTRMLDELAAVMQS